MKKNQLCIIQFISSGRLAPISSVTAWLQLENGGQKFLAAANSSGHVSFFLSGDPMKIRFVALDHIYYDDIFIKPEEKTVQLNMLEPAAYSGVSGRGVKSVWESETSGAVIAFSGIGFMKRAASMEALEGADIIGYNLEPLRWIPKSTIPNFLDHRGSRVLHWRPIDFGHLPFKIQFDEFYRFHFTAPATMRGGEASPFRWN